MQAAFNAAPRTSIVTAAAGPARDLSAPAEPRSRGDRDDFANRLSDARQQRERQTSNDDTGSAAASDAKQPHAEDAQKPEPTSVESAEAAEPQAEDTSVVADAQPADTASADGESADADAETEPAPQQADAPAKSEVAPLYADAAAMLAAASPAPAVDAPTEPAATEGEQTETTPVMVAATAIVAKSALEQDEATGETATLNPPVTQQKLAIAADADAQKKSVIPDSIAAQMQPADGAEIATAVASAAATSDDERSPGEGTADDGNALDLAANGEAAKSTAGSEQQPAKFEEALAKLTAATDVHQKPQASEPARLAPATPLPPEAKFARDNMDNVVTSVRAQVLAGGAGSGGGQQMNIRLDPPELGALEVAVKMVDGRMTASFTTNNDQATQLLSHSLNQLKTTLEASGIAVDRIQVRQASNEGNAQQQGSSSDSNQRGGGYDQQSPHSEQRRREAIQRMWRKLAHGTDEIDLVA